MQAGGLNHYIRDNMEFLELRPPPQPPVPEAPRPLPPRLLVEGIFTDRQLKQTQAATQVAHRQSTRTGIPETTREPESTDRPAAKGQQETRARAHRAQATPSPQQRAERHRDNQDSRPQPAADSTGQGTGPCPTSLSISTPDLGWWVGDQISISL